jgi:hypothetical protein
MARLGCIGLICIAVCAGAITLARRIGSAQVSPLAVIFTNPDGTPCPNVCLFGAQPGKTGFEETISLLQQHPFTRALRRYESGDEFTSVFEDKGADFAVRIAKSQDNDVLAWIMLENINPDLRQVSSATGTLGQILSLLGTPALVDVSIPAVTIAYYATARIELSAVRAGAEDSSPFSINDPVALIRLYGPGGFYGANLSGNPQFRAWAGFQNVSRYRDAPPASFAR